jgi:hypothetical protein
MAAERTKRRRLLSLALLTLLILLGGTDQNVAQQRPSEPAGRSAKLLPDGRWLLRGGRRAESVVSIVDPATGVVSVLSAAAHTPRAWHTATLLADGGVLVVGGVDARGQLVSTVERLDLGTETFDLLAPAGLTPRSGHSATLLSDGRVLLAGGSGRAGAVLDLEKPAQSFEVLVRGERAVGPRRSKLPKGIDVELLQVPKGFAFTPGEQPLLEEVFVLADARWLQLSRLGIVDVLLKGLFDARDLRADDADLSARGPTAHEVRRRFPGGLVHRLADVFAAERAFST